MLLLPIVFAAAEHSGEPGVIVEDAVVAVATVVAIDEKTREITLKGSEGER